MTSQQTGMIEKPPTTVEPVDSWIGKVLRNLVFAGSACICLQLVITQTSLPVVIGCVIVMATVAWISEMSFGRVDRMPYKDKPVLITGCDTGFGYHLAKFLDGMGVVVLAGFLDVNGAGALDLKTRCSDRLTAIQMDVTSDQQIQECKQKVLERCGQKGLWCIVNNAGLNLLGDAELTTMDQYKKVTDINFFGPVRVIKTFLPMLRKSKGRVVNVTSVKGRTYFAGNAVYNGMKQGMEGLSDCLRLEMRKFGVKVIIVEPGDFGGANDGLNPIRTTLDFNEMREEMDDELRQAYGEQYLESQLQSAKDAVLTSAFNIFPVIDAMVDAIFATRPKYRYLISGHCTYFDPYVVRAQLTPYLPTWLMDWWVDRSTPPLPNTVK